MQPKVHQGNHGGLHLHLTAVSQYLNHRFGAGDLQNLPTPLGTIRQREVDDLCIPGELLRGRRRVRDGSEDGSEDWSEDGSETAQRRVRDGSETRGVFRNVKV